MCFSWPNQDREGRIVEGRFSPPSQVMEIWEHQGTMAAELAREDYALRRVRSLLLLPQRRVIQNNQLTRP